MKWQLRNNDARGNVQFMKARHVSAVQVFLAGDGFRSGIEVRRYYDDHAFELETLLAGEAPSFNECRKYGASRIAAAIVSRAMGPFPLCVPGP
jgi:hypothetical protein